ncbi:hypothetical protein Tco_1397650 [Tanacetum coccineum]
MIEEGDFDDDFDDIDDMVNEAMENAEGDIVNTSGAVNTATTGVSAASASVAQTLVKMRSEKAKVKGVDFRDVEESARSTTILLTDAFKNNWFISEYSNYAPNLLGPDLNGKAINEIQHRGMIGPLMNLTTSRPNIQFLTALCKTSSKPKVLTLKDNEIDSLGYINQKVH